MAPNTVSILKTKTRDFYVANLNLEEVQKSQGLLSNRSKKQVSFRNQNQEDRESRYEKEAHPRKEDGKMMYSVQDKVMDRFQQQLSDNESEGGSSSKRQAKSVDNKIKEIFNASGGSRHSQLREVMSPVHEENEAETPNRASKNPKPFFKSALKKSSSLNQDGAFPNSSILQAKGEQAMNRLQQAQIDKVSPTLQESMIKKIQLHQQVKPSQSSND